MRRYLTGGVAVEGKAVGGARGKAGDEASLGKSNDAVGKGSGGLLALESKKVGSETGNVRGSHGSTRDGVGAGGAADPGGEDADTGSEDVDNRAVVGEGGHAIAGVTGTNGEGSGLGGRGDVGSVLGLVASSNSHEETGRDSVCDSGVDSSGLATTQRHAADSTGRAAAGLVIVDGEVDARDHTRVGTRAISAQNTDAEELGLLSNTVGLAADGTSAVSAVAVAISVAAGSIVGDRGSAALEIGVGSVDTSVNDVDTGAGTSRGVVGVGSRAAGLPGDTAETPGGTGLSGVGLLLELESTLLSPAGLHNGILLDVLNTGEPAEDLNDVVGDLTSDTPPVADLEDLVGIAVQEGKSPVDNVLNGIILELDDVLSGNGGTSAGSEKRSNFLVGNGGGDSKGRQGREKRKRNLHVEDVKKRRREGRRM